MAFRVHYWVFAISSFLMMAVVLGIKNILSAKPRLWLRLTEVFALIGLAITAINFVLMQNYAMRLAILGLLGALFNELVFVGTLFHIALLIDLAVGVGGMIVGPVLLIGLGVRLLRRGM